MKLRDELLNGEIFYSMKELRVLAERCHVHYNTIRPHSSLGYRSPAPEAWLTCNTGYGEVERKERFPLLHTSDGGYLNSEIAALHKLIQRHNRWGTPKLLANLSHKVHVRLDWSSFVTDCQISCLTLRMEHWEQEAIRRVLAGDRQEYRVLMERHLPTVLRMTLRVTGNVEDAEEAAQEAFLLAYKKLSKFREDAAFGTWVYRIAMNCSLNLMKRRSRNVAWNAESLDYVLSSQQPVSSQPTPEAALLYAEAQLERERAMSKLTPRERTAFVLRHLEEQPVGVIAEALGISANSARQVVFRAITKLRHNLAPSHAGLGSTVSPSQFLKEPQ